MEEIIIDNKTEDQRLDKYLKRYMPKAAASFLYRMLREKKIKVNGKKTDGNYILKNRDVISIFFSDETMKKFKGRPEGEGGSSNAKEERILNAKKFSQRIIYEDGDVLIYDKPAGMLSQRAGREDISVCEYLIDYLICSNFIDVNSLRFFKPSAVNRLDRNTSGLIVCAKSLHAAQRLSEMFVSRSLEKHYLALAYGKVDEKAHICAYLKKDGRTNRVDVSACKKDGYDKIETVYRPLGYMDKATLLDVELITGKSHQIRAHLSAGGHPLIGDRKYASKESSGFAKDPGRQFLHAYKIIFPKCGGCLENISERSFEAPLPKELKNVLGGNADFTGLHF